MRSFADLGSSVAMHMRPLGFLVLADVLVAAVSLPVAVHLRVGDAITPQQVTILEFSVPLFVAVAIASFWITGLYRRVWRYASIQELLLILRTTTIAIVLMTALLVLVCGLGGLPSPTPIGLPRSTPVIQWLLLLMALGAIRLGPRLVAEGVFRVRRQPIDSKASLALLVGAGDGASLFLRALGHHPEPPCKPVGVVDPDGQHVGLSLRDVPVLGATRDLRRIVEELRALGRPPRLLIFTEPAWRLGRVVMTDLIRDGEALGLEVRLLPSPTDLRRTDAERIELRPIELADLLRRPEANLDRAAINRLVESRTVLVTGAGGTIGSELARQIGALRPAKLLLLEASEFNLYEIDLALREAHPQLPCVPLLCNIRERGRVLQVFERYRPELVFHAAALKHVPMVEMNPCEGALTNVIGTQNVADAACRSGVVAMVQVSSDKAVNPTSAMGATKRLAELYCQALDLHGLAAAAPRFMTVRFGNVLGSSGSLIPLFERQLRRGGPLTVTHVEIKRYFMTVKEAVELVLHASARGLEGIEGVGEIFVLDMGEPVKIMDIARRMIRLAGLQPERDIRIEITGLRPGEKLFEELFDAREIAPAGADARTAAGTGLPAVARCVTARVQRLGDSRSRRRCAGRACPHGQPAARLPAMERVANSLSRGPASLVATGPRRRRSIRDRIADMNSYPAAGGRHDDRAQS